VSATRSPAITIAGESMDLDGLMERATDVSGRLAGASGVVVVAQPTLTAVTGILAGLHAGVPVTPISPDAGPMERQHVFDDSGAALLLEDGQLSALAPAVEGPDDAALILYTSGTTGLPKGVPISNAAIDACLSGLADAWQWTPDDTLVHGLPLYHVHGLVLGVLGALRVGCSLVHTGRPTPASYAAAAGSLYFGVPTVWSRVAADRASAQALTGARLLVSGSAALPAPVFDGIRRLTGLAPVERYGMTETLITLAARADEPAERGMVGPPIAGVEARVVGDDGSPAPRGEIGQLHVRGPSVFSGYLHRPEATAGAFTSDGWFVTGDIASIDERGRFRIVGRASTDLIKSGGYRIGAGEVEDALLSHPAVREAAVIGMPDDDLGQRLVAFVVADSHDSDALITHVAAVLARHKRPRQIVFVDELPRNAMGKVDKSRLRA
jgi:fatty acid CoA ligase FadD36